MPFDRPGIVVTDRPVVAVVVGDGASLPPRLDAVAEAADVHLTGTAADLAAILPEAEVLLVYDFATRLVRDCWPQAGRVRWIHTASAGVDAVLFPESAASEVVITNSHGVFDEAIAEYVLGLILLFAKDLHTTLVLQQRRRWHHRESEMVAGARLLVVGAGSIGRTIARLAGRAGMVVEGIARSERADDPDFDHVRPTGQLRERLAAADFVVIAAPLTNETRSMFGAEEFAAMRKGARLINVGRGAIVDDAALLEALGAGRLAGVALDVFDEEPLPSDHPFWRLPNVVVSPHMSGDFAGWQQTLGALFVENFQRWQRGDELLNVVDKDQLLAAERAP